MHFNRVFATLTIALTFALTIVLMSTTTVAARSTTPRVAGCNDPAKDAITLVDVRENVFQALPSADGCWVFASMPAGPRGRSQIALLKRDGGTLKVERTIQIAGGPTGMVLTHDGKLLVVAAGPRVAFIDTQKLIDGRRDAVEGYLEEPGVLGRIYANVSADDHFLFVADENVATITVVDLSKVRASGFKSAAIIGKIPTGGAPIALVFSPDEKLLYATSQVAPRDYGWPLACKREASTDNAAVNPQGAIHVIDVARATTDPAHSIVQSIPAGCNAVRLVLSPSGDRAYVTARGNDVLLVFDRAKLMTDTAHALIARVPVGTSPVGIAVVDSGRKVIVTNSNRFAGSSDDHQMLTVIDAAKVASGTDAVLGTIPAGAFPREMRVTADGRTLLLTNFASKTIEMIDLARLPIGR